MRDAQINVQVPIMASRFSPWKIAIALVIFSPPDYAAHDGLVQTSVPASAPASSGSATRQST
jgi:hypothetical protein